MTAETFERARFSDADVLAVIAAMDIDIIDEFSKATPAIRNCRITAMLEQGAPVVAHLKLTQAEIERGTPDAVIEAKFEGLTRSCLGAAERRRVKSAVWSLDRAPTVDSVVKGTIF